MTDYISEWDFQSLIEGYDPEKGHHDGRYYQTKLRDLARKRGVSIEQAKDIVVEGYHAKMKARADMRQLHVDNAYYDINLESVWTLFWDMHSGGDAKEPPYGKIYIEASKDKAEVIFYNRFGHNPNRVTCTCCGPDYTISEACPILESSRYHRRGFMGKDESIPLWAYEAKESVLFIRASEITDEEREGDIPFQGYMWVG